MFSSVSYTGSNFSLFQCPLTAYTLSLTQDWRVLIREKHSIVVILALILILIDQIVSLRAAESST